MTPQARAQIVLTSILIVSAMVFVIFGEDELAIALVGAVAGQGAAVGVQTAVNGQKGEP